MKWSVKDSYGKEDKSEGQFAITSFAYIGGICDAKLIQRVETDINAKFRQLIRKKEFFSYIRIDDNFNIHILRNRDISKEDLLAQCKGQSIAALEKAVGPYAVKKLLSLLNVESYEDLKERLSKSGCPSYWLPFEIDKNRLSSGEKQIFVMSL